MLFLSLILILSLLYIFVTFFPIETYAGLINYYVLVAVLEDIALALIKLVLGTEKDKTQRI